MNVLCRNLLLVSLLIVSLFLCACDTSSFLASVGLSSGDTQSDTRQNSENTQENGNIARTLPVAIERATPLQAVAAVRYTATLMPREEVSVLFRVGGYIADIYTLSSEDSDGNRVDAERGAKVNKGDVLVQLRTTDYQGRVVAARGVLNEALASRRQAVLDMERYRSLLDSKAIAQAEYDRIVERVDAIKAKEEAAQGNLTQALELLKDTALFSPIDGIITQKNVQRGQLAVAGSMAYVVADFSRMKALFGVPDWLVTQLHTGDVLPVELSVLGRVAQGTIVSVAPSADAQSRVFDVEIEIDNADGLMKEGMTASVLWRESGLDLRKQSLENESQRVEIPAVPMSAIMRPRGKSSGYAVYVVEKQQDGDSFYAQERQVTLGRVQGDKVELLTGVALGEDIVVLGATRLSDGAAVRILPKGEDGHAVP